MPRESRKIALLQGVLHLPALFSLIPANHLHQHKAHHLQSFISQHPPRLQSASHSEPETPNRHYWPVKNASRNQQSASISSNLASPPISISITTKPAHHHFRLRLAPNPTRFLEPRERQKETRQLPFLHSSQPMTQTPTTNVSFSHVLISRCAPTLVRVRRPPTSQPAAIVSYTEQLHILFPPVLEPVRD